MDRQNDPHNRSISQNMKDYLFHYIKRDDAPEGVKSSMNQAHWADDAQATESAKNYLAMMKGSYKRIDIYVQKGTMWQESGLFVELSDI